MLVNGKEISLEKIISVGEYLDSRGFRRDRIAVELNGNVVPKKEYDSVLLSDTDRLEIVRFMGGG